VSAAAGIRAVIALGANLGERSETLEAAVREIAALPLTDGVRVSPAIETVAVTTEGDDPDAPRYLNAVAEVQTRLAPSVLLAALHGIEAAHGRVRRERWGDRTLDLDLIAWGSVRSSDPAVQLPHPRAAERSFVLAPWLRLDPAAELPGSGRVDELLARLEEAS
jgi:2-amino-4-hydroxy-6-hydroxymethyldihydropteridine diphosphokinase